MYTLSFVSCGGGAVAKCGDEGVGGGDGALALTAAG